MITISFFFLAWAPIPAPAWIIVALSLFTWLLAVVIHFFLDDYFLLKEQAKQKARETSERVQAGAQHASERVQASAQQAYEQARTTSPAVLGAIAAGLVGFVVLLVILRRRSSHRS